MDKHSGGGLGSHWNAAANPLFQLISSSVRTVKPDNNRRSGPLPLLGNETISSWINVYETIRCMGCQQSRRAEGGAMSSEVVVYLPWHWIVAGMSIPGNNGASHSFLTTIEKFLDCPRELYSVYLAASILSRFFANSYLYMLLSILYKKNPHLSASKSRHNDPHNIMVLPPPRFHPPLLPPGNLNPHPSPSQGLQLQQPEP